MDTRAAAACRALAVALALVAPAASQSLFDLPVMATGGLYAWPDAPAGALVADFNADGMLDVVTGALESYRLDTFYGDGQGGLTYGGSTVLPQPPVPPPCWSTERAYPVAVAYLDGDLLPDVICSLRCDGLQPFLNVLNGTFQPMMPVTGMVDPRCAVADMDSDGHADVVAAGPAGYGASQFKLAVYSWVNGALVPGFELLAAPGEHLACPVVFDADQDGDLDIAVYGLGPMFERGIKVLLQGPAMTFTPAGPFPEPLSVPCARRFSVFSGLYSGEVTGDGVPDLVATGVQGAPSTCGFFGSVWVFPGSAATLLGPATVRQLPGINFTGQTLGAQRAAVVDLDLDGLDDLVFPQVYQNLPDVFRLGGVFGPSPGFLSAPAYPFGSKTFVGTGDFDSDGDVDLVYVRDDAAAGTGVAGVALNHAHAQLACATPSMLSLGAGTANPGNAGFELSLAGAPAGAPVAFGVSAAIGGWWSGGCALWPSLAPADLIVHGITSASATGSASLALPIPPEPALIGSVWYAQAVAADPAGPISVNGAGVSASDLRTILVW
jgi:hypothetical protein